jgi:hypothetical protein
VREDKMITTVHEDDLIAWYAILEPVEAISISDFELEDDDDLLQEQHDRSGTP